MGEKVVEIDIPRPWSESSVLVLDVPVFRHRLMVMAALAEGLPVFFVPEQVRVTAMRFNMIHNGRWDQPPFRLASYTPWVTLQEELPGFLPPPIVPAEFCTLPSALVFPFVFLTVFFAVRHKPWAAWIFARRLWSSRHTLIIPIKKGPIAFRPRSFILFLLIIVYLTEACDIKCCFSDI